MSADADTSLESVKADFDRIARLIAEEPEHRDRYEAFLVARLPARGARVLEVGCGDGRFARLLAARGAAVLGIDASPEMIRLARERTPAGAPIEFVCGDFSVHPLGPESYDAVVSVATLHHLPSVPALSRMKGLLKRGGVLLIHDVRSFSGLGDGLRSGLAAILNGDAVWWLRNRLRENHALHEAWRAHGSRERYLEMDEVRALCETTLAGARIYGHPLWRYTVVWTRGEDGA